MAASGHESTRRSCVIVVGSTGLGKSSLIKALSGTEVHVSRGVLSDTKDARVFRDPTSNRILLDTMGAEDSDEKETDEAILRKVLYAIQQESIDDIRIAWVVKKEARKTSSLMTQARFIQSFRVGATDANPWDSLILLVKEGENLPPEEEDLDCQGALAAAAQFGANYLPRHSQDDIPLADIPRFGYTCVDWLTGRKRERKMKAIDSQSFDDRFEEGLLLETEIVERVNELLNGRPSLDMKFKKQKCTTCGVEGDTRCVPVECHERSVRVHPQVNKLIHLQDTPRHVHPFALQKYHNQAIENFHSGSTRGVHRGTVVYSHKGRVEYYHSGSASESHRGTLEWAHSGREENYHDGSTYGEQIQDGVHHPGDTRKVCPSGHCCGTKRHSVAYTDENGREAVSRVECAQCGEGWGGRYRNGDKGPVYIDHCATCCDVYDHLSRWGKEGVPCGTCSGTFPSILENACTSRLVYRYSCCEGSSESTGCKPSYTTASKYRCCDRPEGSNGCKTRMSCCNSSPSSRGCSGRYSCCDDSSGSAGCESKYSCCNRLSSAEGCKSRMTCCAQGPSHTGCSADYSCCGRARSSSGCESRYSCCDRASGSIGCQQRYRCCRAPAGSEGCKAKYSCCNGASGSRGCQGEFVCCGQPVKASTKGCVYACCKKAVGSPECEEQCQRCRGEWGKSRGCTVRRDVLPEFHDMVSLE